MKSDSIIGLEAWADTNSGIMNYLWHHYKVLQDYEPNIEWEEVCECQVYKQPNISYNNEITKLDVEGR